MKSSCGSANGFASAVVLCVVIFAVVVVDCQRQPNLFDDRFDAQQRQQPGDLARDDGGTGDALLRPTNDPPSSGRFDVRGGGGGGGGNVNDADGGRFSTWNNNRGTAGSGSRGQQQQQPGARGGTREWDRVGRFGFDQQQPGGGVDGRGRHATSSLTPWRDYPPWVVGLATDAHGDPLPEPFNEDNEGREPGSIREGELVIRRFGVAYDPLLAEENGSSPPTSSSVFFVFAASLIATVVAAWATTTTTTTLIV